MWSFRVGLLLVWANMHVLFAVVHPQATKESEPEIVTGHPPQTDSRYVTDPARPSKIWHRGRMSQQALLSLAKGWHASLGWEALTETREICKLTELSFSWGWGWITIRPFDEYVGDVGSTDPAEKSSLGMCASQRS